MLRSRLLSDEKVERIMGNLLRGGVVCSALIVLAGAVLFLIHYGATPPAYSTFRGEPAEFRSVQGILKAALALRGRGLIQIGLLVLIATPVARVAFSVIAFALQRDRLYIVVTLAVFILLLFSLIGGGL